MRNDESGGQARGAVEIGPAVGEADRAACYVIRGAVFVAEQGVSSALEPDAEDPGAEHLLARVGGVPLGTVRMVVRGRTGVLGRLAVLPSARGTGLGARLVRALEEHAARCGVARIELHAQLHARDFYTRLGYTAYGSEFTEAGMAHVSMAKEPVG
ncbi:GNAT family N-acetyltransferase [Nocardiopsis sp. CNT-189]|uniref:GNAT family N-acetyltransferase n=1 Tax=Nocardiopsis oceanisediminis TaxID=2816862 RepID=UPI003B37E634